MDIVFLIFGIITGFMTAIVGFYRLLVGKLGVITDPEDGQHYLFLELDRNKVPDILKRNYVLLKVDLGKNSSQK